MTEVLMAVEGAMPFVTTVLVIVTSILVAGTLVPYAIRRFPAARHTVVLVALVTVGLSPLLVAVAQRSDALRSISAGNPILPNSFGSRTQSTAPSQNEGQFLSSRHFSFALVLLGVWAVGFLVSLARLIRGLHMIRELRRTATTDARVVAFRHRLAMALCRNVPDIRVSQCVGVPMATGYLRPMVLLPSSLLAGLDDEQLFQVVLHECAHAFRYDPLVGLYQRLLAGALWFHPLMHIANRLLYCAREELCDNYVLQLVSAAEYSRTLLTVAQSLTPSPTGWFAPALAQSARYLEDRITRLLHPRRNMMTRLTSTHIVTILAVFIGGALVLSSFAAGPKTDEDAIRATITDYIEGYYTGDASRMEKSLHPHYLKHTISESEGKLKMTEWTGLQMVEEVRSHGSPNLPASERKQQITVLDISGDVASAKLVTPHWVDYMTLSKWNGNWKIVSVVLRETY